MHRRYQQAGLTKAIAQGARHVLPKGAIVSFDDSRRVIGALETGYIKRYTITEDGYHSVQAIYDKGDIFPLSKVYEELFELTISTGIEEVYYETLTQSVLYTLSKEQLTQQLEAAPELYRDLSYAAGVRLKSNVQQLENASMKSVYKRVVHQLIFLAELYGVPDGSCIGFGPPVTHQLIANMLNVARESVSHSMVKLHNEGIISKGAHISITNLEALRDQL